MRLDGLAGAGIPYYGMIKKAMPGPAKESRKKVKGKRLTEIDPKTKKTEVEKGSKHG